MRNVVYLSDRSDRGLKNRDSAFALPRLELEMALDLTATDGRPWIEHVAEATAAAAGELLFVLPDPDLDGEIRQCAMIRLQEDQQDCLVAVCQSDNGYIIKTEDQIDTELAEFARATANLMHHLRSDDRVLRPLAEGLH